MPGAGDTFCTPEAVQAYLAAGGLVTSDLVELGNLVRRCTGMGCDAMGLPPRQDGKPRTPYLDTYVERYNGGGGYKLLLQQYPVASVEQLIVDGKVIPGAPDTAPLSAGFVVDGALGVVGLRGAASFGFGYPWRFTKGLQNVEVHYTAGLPEGDPIVDGLEAACVEHAALAWKRIPRTGLKSESFDKATTAYITAAMPDTAAAFYRSRRRRVFI